MNGEKEDRDKLVKRFPSPRAREAADRAIDVLPEAAPMTQYIDTWIAAYRKAGGQERGR